MSPDVIGWIAGGIVTLIATLWSGRASRKTKAVEARVGEITANSNAAREAQETYSGIVADLRKEIDRLRFELAEMRTQLDTATGENTALKRQVATMQRTVDRMRRLLETHSIPVPAD